SEARTAALRRFGGLERHKADARDRRGVSVIENSVRDLRYGWRTLLKAPVFTAVAVLTLALGIGATSTMFTIVNAVLLRPLPYPGAGRLVSISESQKGQDIGAVADQDALEWRHSANAFNGLAIYAPAGSVLTDAGEPAQLRGASVSADFFPTLGVPPARGRNFRADESVPGAPRVVMLSHALWQNYFAADSSVVGQFATLDGTPYTVVGVMPAGFEFPVGASYWTPLQPAPPRPNLTFYYSV